MIKSLHIILNSFNIKDIDLEIHLLSSIYIAF